MSEEDSAAREARQEASHATHRLSEDARRAAGETAERVRGEAYDRAGRAKDGVAREVSGLAEALRSAAGEAREGSFQERTFGQLADGLADASEALSGRDLNQIAGEVSGFARRNPLAFLGGAALAGFAATRFVRASSEPRPRSDAALPSASRDAAAGPVPSDRETPGQASSGTASSGTGASRPVSSSPTPMPDPGRPAAPAVVRPEGPSRPVPEAGAAPSRDDTGTAVDTDPTLPDPRRF